MVAGLIDRSARITATVRAFLVALPMARLFLINVEAAALKVMLMAVARVTDLKKRTAGPT